MDQASRQRMDQELLQLLQSLPGWKRDSLILSIFQELQPETRRQYLDIYKAEIEGSVEE